MCPAGLPKRGREDQLSGISGPGQAPSGRLNWAGRRAGELAGSDAGSLLTGTLSHALISADPRQPIPVPSRGEPGLKPGNRTRGPVPAGAHVKSSADYPLETKPMPGQAANAKVSSDLGHRPFQQRQQRDLCSR